MKCSIPYTGTQVQSSFFVNIYFRIPPQTLRAMIFPQYGHRGRMQRRRCGLRHPLGLVQILRIRRRRQHRHPTGHRFPLCTRHRGRRRGGAPTTPATARPTTTVQAATAADGGADCPSSPPTQTPAAPADPVSSIQARPLPQPSIPPPLAANSSSPIPSSCQRLRDQRQCLHGSARRHQRHRTCR